MIQGYAIYLRTHRETGRQYGGCVWWTNSNGTAEKSCARRWKIEDRIGIRGLFGGFDSKMILTEVRSDAPEMSEGLYRIRIASDEQTTIDRIAADRRLNLINPLGVFGGLELREEFCRLGGRNAAQACKEKGIGIFGLSEEQQKQNGFASLNNQPREIRAEIGKKCRDGKIGIFAPGYDFGKGGRAGGSIGGRSKSPAKIAASLKNLPSVEIKRANGKKAKEQGTGIFSSGYDTRTAMHVRWHVKRNIQNSKCSLCLEKQNAGPDSTST